MCWGDRGCSRTLGHRYRPGGDVFCHFLEGAGRVGLLVAVGGATGTAELEGGERLRDIMRRWGK